MTRRCTTSKSLMGRRISAKTEQYVLELEMLHLLVGLTICRCGFCPIDAHLSAAGATVVSSKSSTPSGYCRNSLRFAEEDRSSQAHIAEQAQGTRRRSRPRNETLREQGKGEKKKLEKKNNKKERKCSIWRDCVIYLLCVDMRYVPKSQIADMILSCTFVYFCHTVADNEISALIEALDVSRSTAGTLWQRQTSPSTEFIHDRVLPKTQQRPMAPSTRPGHRCKAWRFLTLPWRWMAWISGVAV
ncbi:hypothetical protein GGR52DRAFT_149822 [Hypoxylon sp. FL1284]|nr:hypothetical protein GGR52DRAFT_149822 [Hypoxylon sp. FL1284]